MRISPRHKKLNTRYRRSVENLERELDKRFPNFSYYIKKQAAERLAMQYHYESKHFDWPYIYEELERNDFSSYQKGRKDR